MNLAPDPGEEDVEAAVELLIEAGCPERTAKCNGARDAVEAALALGWSGEEVLTAVDGWLAYAETPAGRWVRHRGFLAGKRIAAGQSPPELSREEQTRRYLQRAWEARGLS